MFLNPPGVCVITIIFCLVAPGHRLLPRKCWFVMMDQLTGSCQGLTTLCLQAAFTNHLPPSLHAVIIVRRRRARNTECGYLQVWESFKWPRSPQGHGLGGSGRGRAVVMYRFVLGGGGGVSFQTLVYSATVQLLVVYTCTSVEA